MYGPLETMFAASVHLSPALSIAAFCVGRKDHVAIKSGKNGVAAERVHSSVVSSSALTPSESGGAFPAAISTPFLRLSAAAVYFEAVFGSGMRLKVYSKSFAVIGEPSDHLLPGRSLKVQTVASL